MEIIDTRNTTPDKYSIKGVRIKYESFGDLGVNTWLSVSLKPKAYSRDRFQGASYETKKHGARELKIEFDELQEIVETLRGHVHLCCQVLHEHDLLDKLDKLAESKRKQRTPAENPT